MLRRSLQIAVLLTAALSMLGAGTPATRFDKLGHKLMCTCGCAEGLLECNHVGCPDSPGLITQLHAQVDSGASDSGILTWFASQYGATVLAAPLRDNFFDRSSWFVPFAVLLLGIVGIIAVVRLWQGRQSRLAPAAPLPPPTSEDDALRNRIRNETEY